MSSSIPNQSRQYASHLPADCPRPGFSTSSKPFAKHKRNEVQASGHDETAHKLKPFQNAEDFLDFLAIPEGHLQTTNKKFTFRNFIQKVNKMADSMRREYFPNKPLLVFKSTEHVTPRGHVTDTKCRPNIIAAFKGDWTKDNITLWPCIQLVGEQTSEEKSQEDREEQAVSYLHHLLLARPDLHVVHGLLTSKHTITFLLGVGGYGAGSFDVSWSSTGLYRLMHAFVYRIYEPGDHADPSYVNIVPNWEKNLVTYTVRITNTEDGAKTTIECPNFEPIFASNPFGTRTHVFSNPNSEVKINNKVLTVLKDQVCYCETRFHERDILSHIHTPEEEPVPGVVQVVYDELITIPPFVTDSESKAKYRIGLVQSGRPFSSITTLRQMLEIAFDILEVLRYLRVKRQVLHRDISRGNVLHIEDETLPIPPMSYAGPVSAPDAEPSGADEAKEVPLCFIKYLLGESKDPRKTSALLIDFNCAEHLESREDLGRTGTPIFMARAVEMGHAVELAGVMRVPEVPNSPEHYALIHPDRIKKFPPGGVKPIIEAPMHSDSRQWRHELDHDAESVFWLLLFWVVVAMPAECPTETINPVTWFSLLGAASYRDMLISTMGGACAWGIHKDTTHSVYQPALPLLAALASILLVDRFWLEESDSRNDPEYVCEAFQRLILQFLLDHRNEEFLTHKIGPKPRKRGSVLGMPSVTTTTSRSSGNLKRSSSPEGGVTRSGRRFQFGCVGPSRNK